MDEVMITLRQCANYSGLTESEMVVGAAAASRHRILLSSYLIDIEEGAHWVRETLVSDIRSCVGRGALMQAADLLIVLREFLSKYPEARLGRRSGKQIAIASSGAVGQLSVTWGESAGPGYVKSSPAGFRPDAAPSAVRPARRRQSRPPPFLAPG